MEGGACEEERASLPRPSVAVEAAIVKRGRIGGVPSSVSFVRREWRRKRNSWSRRILARWLLWGWQDECTSGDRAGGSPTYIYLGLPLHRASSPTSNLESGPGINELVAETFPYACLARQRGEEARPESLIVESGLSVCIIPPIGSWKLPRPWRGVALLLVSQTRDVKMLVGTGEAWFGGDLLFVKTTLMVDVSTMYVLPILS